MLAPSRRLAASPLPSGNRPLEARFGGPRAAGGSPPGSVPWPQQGNETLPSNETKNMRRPASQDVFVIELRTYQLVPSRSA